jgi:hypothetical protein
MNFLCADVKEGKICLLHFMAAMLCDYMCMEKNKVTPEST